MSRREAREGEPLSEWEMRQPRSEGRAMQQEARGGDARRTWTEQSHRAVLNHPWSDQPTGKQPGLQFSPNQFLQSSRVETDGVTGSTLQVALQHPVAWTTGPSTWQASTSDYGLRLKGRNNYPNACAD